MVKPQYYNTNLWTLFGHLHEHHKWKEETTCPYSIHFGIWQPPWPIGTTKTNLWSWKTTYNLVLSPSL
jgi:hypothetical protein